MGCDSRVVQGRDGWATIGGTRSGSYLMVWGVEPLRVSATDPEHIPNEQLYLLGVAHTRCINVARARLESGTAYLPPELPTLQAETDEDVPRPLYALDRPVDANACPFCDASDNLTREHVWPDWYTKELQARGAVLTGDIVRNNRIEVTVPVCAECNNKWMSVLENDCKDLMISMTDAAVVNHTAIELNRQQQTRLATWGLKTAYLIDAYESPVVPRGFLHEFALQRVPNPWTVVSIAGYTPDVAARADKRALDFLTSSGKATNNSPNAFAVTFTILNLLFQVMGHFNGGKWSMRDDRKEFEGALFRTWPDPASKLSWPPALGFSNSSWDMLVDSVKDKP